MYKCSIRVKAFGSSTEVPQATFYTKWCSQNMSNTPVKYNSLFSASGMNKCPASFFRTMYILSLVQTYWAAEEKLVFSTLSHCLALQQVSFSPSLGNFSTECVTKGIGSCCLFLSQVSVQDVNDCMSQILRNGMCSLKIVHAKELPVHEVSHPAIRNIQKPQEWRGQSQMPCTDIRLQESFWLFKIIVDRK